MQERKRSPWLFAGLILILVLSLLFGYTGLSCIAGCINGETAYEVTVIGFENASIPQHLCIYLPLPLVNGESLFPDDIYQNKQFSGWESSVVETPRGKMLVFHTTSLPVQNLHARFQKTGIIRRQSQCNSSVQCNGYVSTLGRTVSHVCVSSGLTFRHERVLC